MAEVTTDSNTIRQWAESKGGRPAAVGRTHEGGDVGIIRITFPDNPQPEHGSLVEISWDEFFKQFDESKLAFCRGKFQLEHWFLAQLWCLDPERWFARGRAGGEDSVVFRSDCVKRQSKTAGDERPPGS